MRVRRTAVFLSVTVAAVLATAACASEFKPDASTPNAAVRTFLGHLVRGDGAAAYTLLSKEAQGRCSRDFLLDRVTSLQQELERSRVVVRETTVRDARATVLATVDPGRVDISIMGPRRSSFETTFALVRDGAEWRLKEVGWPWGYCDFPKPMSPDAPIPAEPPRLTQTPAPVEATPGGGR